MRLCVVFALLTLSSNECMKAIYGWYVWGLQDCTWLRWPWQQHSHCCWCHWQITLSVNYKKANIYIMCSLSTNSKHFMWFRKFVNYFSAFIFLHILSWTVRVFFDDTMTTEMQTFFYCFCTNCQDVNISIMHKTWNIISLHILQCHFISLLCYF